MLIPLFLFSSLANAATCPDLTGDYVCPAYGDSQPESPLNVDQRTWRRVTEYTYTFENLHPPGKPREPLVSKVRYSPRGENDDGRLFRCDGRLLSILDSPESKKIQQHYRESRTGDYVVIYVNRDGTGTPREVQRCVADDRRRR